MQDLSRRLHGFASRIIAEKPLLGFPLTRDNHRVFPTDAGAFPQVSRVRSGFLYRSFCKRALAIASSQPMRGLFRRFRRILSRSMQVDRSRGIRDPDSDFAKST